MKITNSADRILVIQLARTGDLLMSIPAIQALRQEYPKAEIHVMARKKFAGILKNIPDIDKLIEFDTEDFLSTLFEESSSSAMQTDRMLTKLDGFFRSLDHYSLAIDLTFSETSSYFLHLIKARIKQGLSRDKEGFLDIKGEWPRYIYSVVQTRSLNSYHMSDLFKLISGVSSQITQKKPFISLEGWTNAKSMVSELISNYPTPIIIQTGASQEFKSLPIEQYKIICSELLKENSNFCFILVGSKSEEKQAKKLEEINPHRILNLCGKTSIEEYSALISMGRLFIGSDSSGSHIAAFLDTPQVNLQVGPSSAYETAPYCNSALILSPSLDTQEDFKNTPEILKRQSALDPQVILLGIQYQLENYGDLDGFENYIVDHEFMHLTGSTRAWSTQIKVLDNGSSELYLNPLIKHYPTHQDFFRSLYYLIFKYRIEGQIETIPYIDISSNQTASKLENSIQGLEVLYRTADFGLKYSKMMERASVTNNREEILKFGTKLSEVDTLLKQLTVTYPEFQTFIHFYEVKRACSKGFNLVSLAREHKLTFQEMIEDIRIIFDLIQANVTELKNKYENKNKSLKKTKNIQAPAINIKEN